MTNQNVQTTNLTELAALLLPVSEMPAELQDLQNQRPTLDDELNELVNLMK